jgi:hypothetical protein
VYTGGFRSGLRHGQGILTLPNGDRFEGGYSSDMRQGYGVLFYSDGTVDSGLVYIFDSSSYELQIISF